MVILVKFVPQIKQISTKFYQISANFYQISAKFFVKFHK